MLVNGKKKEQLGRYCFFPVLNGRDLEPDIQERQSHVIDLRELPIPEEVKDCPCYFGQHGGWFCAYTQLAMILFLGTSRLAKATSTTAPARRKCPFATSI